MPLRLRASDNSDGTAAAHSNSLRVAHMGLGVAGFAGAGVAAVGFVSLLLMFLVLLPLLVPVLRVSLLSSVSLLFVVCLLLWC